MELKIIHRARDGDFSIHSPTNKRFLTSEYIEKRRFKKEAILAKKAEKKAKREQIAKSRYEHKLPGNLGHIDLKLLPPIKGEKIIKNQKEYLLSLVDDCTRMSYFEIIQGKNQHQVKRGLERIFARCPISFSAILSDNGKEFKGSQKQENGYVVPQGSLEASSSCTAVYTAKTEEEGQATRGRNSTEKYVNKTPIHKSSSEKWVRVSRTKPRHDKTPNQRKSRKIKPNNF